MDAPSQRRAFLKASAVAGLTGAISQAVFAQATVDSPPPLENADSGPIAPRTKLPLPPDVKAITQPVEKPPEVTPPVSALDAKGTINSPAKFQATATTERTGVDELIWEGERPLAVDDAEWAGIVKRVREYYPLPSGSEAFGETFNAIDRNFRILGRAKSEPFRWFQVGVLLNQAADFLERALQARVQWNDLSAKAFNVRRDLEEFFLLDSIHTAETMYGYYTADYKQASHQLSADSATHVAQIWNHRMAVNRFNSWDATYEALSTVVQRDAWLSVYPAFKYQFGTKYANEFDFAGVKKTKEDHLIDSAIVQLRLAMTKESREASASEAVERAAATSNRHQFLNSDEKLRWEANNIFFKRERANTARQLIKQKARAFVEAGGALNFKEQMDAIRVRFEADVIEVLGRMAAAKVGLRKIFGIEMPLPADSRPYGFFDDCLVSVRTAISDLLRFSHGDQGYILPVSLRALVGEAAWTAGKRNGFWSFKITEQMFEDQFHLRMTGLSVTIVGDQALGMWQAVVVVPQSSFYRHQNGDKSDVSQADVPPIRMGRIERREAVRDADVSGVVTLHNVSPFGTWNLTLSPRSLQGVTVTEVEDLNVHLHLSVRTKGV